MSEYCKNCEKLTNKNNRLEEELNQIKLLLEGKNAQYNSLKVELKETQKELQNFRQTNSFACKLAKKYEADLKNAIEALNTAKHKIFDDRDMLAAYVVIIKALEQIGAENK